MLADLSLGEQTAGYVMGDLPADTQPLRPIQALRKLVAIRQASRQSAIVAEKRGGVR